MDLYVDNPGRLVRRVATGVGIFFVLLIAGCESFYTVEQGERGLHLRGGELVGVEHPGFRMKFPLIDDVKFINVRQVATKWQADGQIDTRMETYSKDQQPADIALNVTWSIPNDDKTIASVFTNYGSLEGLANAVLLPEATKAVKNVFGTYDAVTVIQQRAKFNADVAAALTTLLAGHPVILSGVQIQDISFSDEYENAVEARMMAQVEVQKREQQKQTSQIDADMLVIQAEADAKQRRLRGEADAANIRLRGEAEAAAIKARSDALASNNRLIELTVAEKWNGTLPSTMVPGSAVPFISVAGR